MTQIAANPQDHITTAHRNVLVAAALACVLLIAMGGVLCVTQSIRSCPDWPGCFGRLVPPLATSPILEFTHRFLAAGSGLLILAAAIFGLARTRRLRWILIPPLVACLLVVEVSFFGALVVLRGLAPGWAAVDVGSALLVVVLLVTTAVKAQHPDLPDRLTFRSPYARLVLATLGVVYVVFVSGVLVAGQGSITGCLGWPVYSLNQVKIDLPGAGNILRLIVSGAGVLMIAWMLFRTLRNPGQRPSIRRTGIWLLAVVLLEALLQILLLAIGYEPFLLVPYTITAAAFWGLLVRLAAQAGMDTSLG